MEESLDIAIDTLAEDKREKTYQPNGNDDKDDEDIGHRGCLAESVSDVRNHTVFGAKDAFLDVGHGPFQSGHIKKTNELCVALASWTMARSTCSIAIHPCCKTTVPETSRLQPDRQVEHEVLCIARGRARPIEERELVRVKIENHRERDENPEKR